MRPSLFEAKLTDKMRKLFPFLDPNHISYNGPSNKASNGPSYRPSKSAEADDVYSGDRTSLEKEHNKIPENSEKPEISVDKKKLIAHLLNSNSVGLSDIENLVVRGTYGIKKDGNMIDPVSAIKMGEMLKVTGARISQIKTAAFAKITEYIKDRGIPTPEDAALKLDLEENKKR